MKAILPAVPSARQEPYLYNEAHHEKNARRNQLTALILSEKDSLAT